MLELGSPSRGNGIQRGRMSHLRLHRWLVAEQGQAARLGWAPSRPKGVGQGLMWHPPAAAPVHNELPKKTGMITLSTLRPNLRER